MTHHYLESGLDNVYLLDGYRLHDTPYGEGVSIEDTAGLNRRIGKMLVVSAPVLNGAELRFLRKEMDLGQRDLALEIGASEQTLRLWEKHRDKAIPGTADRIVRAMYIEHVDGKVAVRHMLDRLVNLEVDVRRDIRLARAQRSWRIQASTPILA